MKIAYTIITLSICINLAFSSTLANQMNSNYQLTKKARSNHEVQKHSIPVQKSANTGLSSHAIDLPEDTNIFYKGWIKYFKYRDSPNQKKPNKFFLNEAFKKQGPSSKAQDEVKIIFLIMFSLVMLKFLMANISLQ